MFYPVLAQSTVLQVFNHKLHQQLLNQVEDTQQQPQKQQENSTIINNRLPSNNILDIDIDMLQPDDLTSILFPDDVFVYNGNKDNGENGNTNQTNNNNNNNE
eukprot:UN00250